MKITAFFEIRSINKDVTDSVTKFNSFFIIKARAIARASSLFVVLFAALLAHP